MGAAAADNPEVRTWGTKPSPAFKPKGHVELCEALGLVDFARGAKLSGGQRQRIAIARALLKDAPILILDEATSHLDTESEVLVQRALANLMQDRTVIVIAHRLSTIQNVSKIVVIENGRLVQTGTDRDLLTVNGRYRQLHNLQYGEFSSEVAE